MGRPREKKNRNSPPSAPPDAATAPVESPDETPVEAPASDLSTADASAATIEASLPTAVVVDVADGPVTNVDTGGPEYAVLYDGVDTTGSSPLEVVDEAVEPSSMFDDAPPPTEEHLQQLADEARDDHSVPTSPLPPVFLFVPDEEMPPPASEDALKLLAANAQIEKLQQMLEALAASCATLERERDDLHKDLLETTDRLNTVTVELGFANAGHRKAMETIEAIKNAKLWQIMPAAAPGQPRVTQQYVLGRDIQDVFNATQRADVGEVINITVVADRVLL